MYELVIYSVLIAFNLGVVLYIVIQKKNKKSSGEKDLILMGELFLNVFNTSENGIILLQDAKIVNCNLMALNMFGRSRNEIIGRSIIDLSPEKQPDNTVSEIKEKKLLERIFSEGVANFEWMHQKLNGEMFLVQVSAASFEANGVHYVSATIRDITKLREQETELQNYRLRLEKLVEEKTRELESSYQELQTINEELDASNEELYASNEELQATNTELDKTNNFLLKTQAEKAVVEEKLNHFISQSTEAIIIINEKGIVEDWNNTMVEITGVEKEKALGSFIWDVTYMMAPVQEKADLVKESFEKNTLRFFEEIKTGNFKEQVSESQIRHYDSSLRYIRTTLFPIITEQGNYGGVIISDITQKKAIEAQLETYRIDLEKLLKQRTEHLEQLSVRFKEVYNNSSDAITFMDISDEVDTIKVFDMNPAAKKLFRISDEQLANGVLIEDFLSKERIDTLKRYILPKLLAGEPVTFVNEEDEGNGFWRSVVYPIMDENGIMNRTAIFSRDITAEYEQEKISAIFSSAIESWPFEFWVCNKEGVCILQNKASQDLWGNITGKKLKDLKLPDDIMNKSLSDESIVLKGQRVSSELVFETEQATRYVLTNLNPIVTKNEITGFLGINIDITHQKNAEQALRESEKRLNQLLSSVTDYKFTVEFANGTVVRTVHSEGCMAVTGYSPADFEKNPYLWYEMVHVDDKPLLSEWSEKVDQGIEVEPFEHRIIHKTGKIIWVSNTTVYKKDSKGAILGYDGLISDITKRKNAELALRESEKRFYDVIDMQPLPIGIVVEGKPLLYNRNFTEKFGYTIEDVPTIEKWIEKLISDPKDHVVVMNNVKKAITKNNNEITKYKKDYRIRCKDGSEKWVEISDRSIGDMLVTVFNDITERKESEEKIRLSEEKYRLLAENVDDVIWKLDINTLKYAYFSPSITKLTGYSVEEILNFTPDMILMPDSLNNLSIVLPQWIDEFNTTHHGTNRIFEYQIRHKNGYPLWVEINASFVTDDSGVITEIVATSRSIEERKSSELAMRESEEKLRSIFNTSKDGIAVVDRNMNLLEINQSALKRSKYEHGEIIRQSIFGFLLKENNPNLIQYFDSVWNDKEVKNIETEVLIRNDGYFPVEISATPMDLNNMKVLLLLIRDISERKQHEKELLQSVINTEEQERVNFSQELHDGLGPLLSAAKMYVEWLAEPGSTVDPSVIIPDIKKLLEESTRTVKDISFKLSPHILQNYGVLESLKEYAEKVQKTGKTQIKIQATDIGRFEELTETIVYRVVCECINNTLKHARAGHIEIEMCIYEDFLIINYADDGKGFDVEKLSNERKGIGLLNMQSRLKSINGSFRIQSFPDKGTKVSINVPITLK